MSQGRGPVRRAAGVSARSCAGACDQGTAHLRSGLLCGRSTTWVRSAACAGAMGAILVSVLAACSASAAPARDTSGPGLAGVGTLPRPASAWPASGYDARRSSGTSAVGPQTGHLRWTRMLEGSVTPGPVVGVDGSVLAASNAGVLHALDPTNGKDRWTFSGGGTYGVDLSTSPAVLGDGTILWPGPRSRLFALTARGRLLWQVESGGQPLSPAVAGAHRVYVSDSAGHLTALEVVGASHRKVWTLDTGGQNYASATVGPDGTIYTASDNSLVGVRDLGERGVERWRFETRSLVEVSNGVAADGTVVLGTNDDDEFGVHADGSVAWTLHKGDYAYSSSVVRPDGTAYFGDNSGYIRAVDATTGKVKFEVRGGAVPQATNIWTALAVDASGDAYYGTVSGHIYGFSASGRQLFDIATGATLDSYPAIGADGTLYIGATSGKLYAVGPA